MNFRVLFKDEFLIAIEKPAGYHVHAPEDPAHQASRRLTVLPILKKQVGEYLYPVHRLDRATSGVLIFGLTSDVASKIQHQFKTGQILKTYFAVCRGWILQSETVHQPITLENREYPSETSIDPLARLELPHAVGKYATARYSLLRVIPKTGRMHQIRRHCAHLSHPLVGDTIHGDGTHNRFFRERLGIPGLRLKAYSLTLTHPITGDPLHLRARWGSDWLKVFDLFGQCPWGNRNT